MNLIYYHLSEALLPDDIIFTPRYNPHASGIILRTCIGIGEESKGIRPGHSCLINTGLHISLPPGFEGQIRPYIDYDHISSNLIKSDVTVLNAPGTIDSDYTGEIKVLLINHGLKYVTYTHGDAIALLVIAPIFQAKFIKCEELELTERGNRGFGSTNN